MEDDSWSFRELSRELLEEFGSLGRRMTPHMRYANRGERGVMRVLEFAGPVAPSELADRTHLSSARVANVLRSLEEKGYVTRAHSDADRRRVTVSLTEAGHDQILREKREFEAQAASFLSQLGEEDTREALRILRKTNAIIDKNRADGTAVILGAPAARDPQDREGGAHPCE